MRSMDLWFRIRREGRDAVWGTRMHPTFTTGDGTPRRVVAVRALTAAGLALAWGGLALGWERWSTLARSGATSGFALDAARPYVLGLAAVSVLALAALRRRQVAIASGFGAAVLFALAVRVALGLHAAG